jgi:hypothetical protein
MFNPEIWSYYGVPLNWGILPFDVPFLDVLTARDAQEVELMIDFDNQILWRRNLNETRELGL